jgi:hypothetical protein
MDDTTSWSVLIYLIAQEERYVTVKRGTTLSANRAALQANAEKTKHLFVSLTECIT